MPKRRDRDRGRELTVLRTAHIPLVEVSGVTLRRDPDGDVGLIAIGDRSAVAAWVVLPDDDEGDYEWSETDVSALEGSLVPAHDSQLEVVCADGAGRVLLIQEDPPRAELLDWAERRVLATIALDVPMGHALHGAWIDPDASHGEGAVLLANGHLLVAKEKDPPAFMEFGPARGVSSGCSPSTVLSDGAPWPVKPGEHTYVPLATWMPSKELLAACEDFSDLEGGPDHRLYMLSDKSASIARLPDLPAGGGLATADRTWRIMDADGKPEGLAFTRHGRAIVTLDTRQMMHNLVVLDPPIVTWW